MEDLKIYLPQEIQKKKFQGLDGLRGLSIVMVIASHALIDLIPAHARYIGKTGVYIFFVISGFLITTLLLKEKLVNGSISLKNFYKRRAFRILPVVYLYLIILFFLNIVYNLGITRASFTTSFLFIKNFSMHKDWYTGHFWTLGIEEQFYLIFPFLITILPLRFYKRLVILLICIIPPLSYVYFMKIDLHVFHVNWSTHLALGLAPHLFGQGTVLILIGSLFSILFLTGSNFINRIYTKANGLVSLVLFLVGILSCISVFPWYIENISEVFFGICIAIAMLLNLKEGSFFGRTLSWKPLKNLGILSYSLYVWQELFTHKQPWNGNLFLNITALFVVAGLSYYFYEKKFLQYKDRFRKAESDTTVHSPVMTPAL
ncbi:hypothetical protein A3860_37090 [Niastella vici]|uniref:Acyltransferase 3 domain-containing protein n=1 Tax=Niastella vici TaxID=1703345 RepID=A0A1V9FMF3_9BACT|nr:acyltransferase [Niastella vici]OQP59534.1 hypothetical protein A3860_37090 [Niastella vici]